MRKSSEDHKLDSATVHGNKYSYELWPSDVRSTDIVKIICPDHGQFSKKLLIHKRGSGCASCTLIETKKRLTKSPDYFKSKCNKIHNYKYDYKLWDKTNTPVHSKQPIICPIHGVFHQLISNHMRGHECKECGTVVRAKSNSKGSEFFKNRSNEAHNNKYDYSKWPTDVKTTDAVTIGCNIHGDFIQNVGDHAAGHGCKKCAVLLNMQAIAKGTAYFEKNCHEVHNNKYDYSKWPDDIKAKDFVTIGCNVHGDFIQKLSYHMAGNGCTVCGIITRADYNSKGGEFFKNRSNEVHHNKYDYSKWPDDVKTKDFVTITCNLHGDFTQVLSNHMTGNGCPVCGIISRSKYHSNGSEFFKDYSHEVHDNKYDYSKWPDDIKITDTVTIGCNLHGDFTQKLGYHMTGSGCNKCGVESAKVTMMANYGVDHPSYINFPMEVLPLLNDVEWLTNQHHVLKKPLTIIATDLEIDPSTVGNYCRKHNIEIKGFFQSAAENEVSDFVESLGVTVTRGNRSIISPYELDIVIPDHNIAIEYCGLYWHSEQRGKDKHYHKRKHDMCKEKNIQLITIFEDEWWYRQTQVKNKLKALLGKLDQKRIYARKCQLVSVDTITKQKFFDLNHIQGNGPGSISVGLEYDGELIACMSFIKQKDRHYLNRYATSASVPGGFSKLLTHFKRNNKWSEIVSFADCRWSDGSLYQNTGWVLESVLVPDYAYIRNYRRIHKFNYRRKNLPNLLEHFDPNLSEVDNCDQNGILRIWDCGKLRYVATNNIKRS